MRKTRKRLAVLVVLGSTLIGACTGGAENVAPGEDDSRGEEVVEIDVVNIAYDPGSIEVGAGTKVKWTNRDENVHHTVTSGLPGDNGVPGVSEATPPSPDGVFDGDMPDAQSAFTFTFDEPGTYEYFCRVHPSMTGEVIVT